MLSKHQINERLWRAVESGSLEDIAAAAREGADVNARDEGGETALTRATAHDHGAKRALASVRCLLKLGARVSEEKPNRAPGTSVHYAAANGYAEALRELLAADGKVALELFDDMGRTPLICAVKGARRHEAALLLAAGANVDAHDEQTVNNTALAVAVQELNPAMVELLLHYGADPTIQGWMHLSPLDRARDWNAEGADPELRRVFNLLNERAKRRSGRRPSKF